MATSPSSYGTSRAVLVGVSDYAHSGFTPVRAADNSVAAMQALLSDPDLCGWPLDSVIVISNPGSVSELGIRLTELARETTGVLLLYFVGHGVVTERAELCLALSSTHPDHPGISGLRWETIRHAFLSSPARVRIGILDCCFSGRAIEALSGTGDQALADLADIRGSYILTASRSNRAAHVPPAHEQHAACTTFTAELRDLIRTGIPGKADWLTFSDIYPELRQRLTTKGFPAPDRRGTDTADQFRFTANAASRHISRLSTQAPDSPASDPTPAAGGAPSPMVRRAAEQLVRDLQDRVHKLIADLQDARAAGDTDKAATTERQLEGVRALLQQAIKTRTEFRS